MAAQAYIIFHCSSRELQTRAGFDGWVMLLREAFDTEDQAWPQERLRLGAMAKRKMRRLESGGVELDMLQLVTSCHLLLDPPPEDSQEERIWCIENFRGKMYDFVSDDRELIERLRRFQEELLMSARLAAPSTRVNRGPSIMSTTTLDGGAISARPSGDPSSPEIAASRGSGAAPDGLEPLSEAVEASKSPKVGAMSAASLAAALELTDLESAQQRFGGGTFLPILPLGNGGADSMERGLPTLPTVNSSARWAASS